jgi:hypothetical protein
VGSIPVYSLTLIGVDNPNEHVTSETEFQEELLDALKTEDGDVSVALGDKGLTVVVECNGTDAAYTADEARNLALDLAYEIELQMLSRDYEVVETVRELADEIEEGFND